jgi:hypothetical protein
LKEGVSRGRIRQELKQEIAVLAQDPPQPYDSGVDGGHRLPAIIATILAGKLM